jgi:hypothetical protein
MNDIFRLVNGLGEFMARLLVGARNAWSHLFSGYKHNSRLDVQFFGISWFDNFFGAFLLPFVVGGLIGHSLGLFINTVIFGV